MTDTDTIARGIALTVSSLLNYVPVLADANYAAVIEEIAAALREIQEQNCWIWTGAKEKGNMGYGKLGPHVAHRLVYETLRSRVPKGLELDHLCRNPLCVNPDHLSPVTHRENVLRGISPSAINARKQGCNRCGKAFDHIGPTGKRRCTQCSRERHKIAEQKRLQRGTGGGE